MRSWLVPLLAAGSVLIGCERERSDVHATSELRALVDTMLPSLARIASLQPLQDVRLERRDSAGVRAYVERQLDQELPPDALAALHRTYALLGLVPDTLDLRALMLRLYTEQIVGYYDPAEQTLYVVDGVAPDALAPVLAHELVHALQDQHADLDSLIARERGNDRQTAAHAALEGHATISMFAWLAEQAEGRRLDPADLPSPAVSLRAGLQTQDEQFPVFREAPTILRETLLFPYFDGAEFMYRLWQAEPSTRPAPLGEWLPASTEQVLHPERFLRERDDPTELRLAPQQGEWQAVGDDDTFGELETGILLAAHLGEPARAASHGWDGDRYRLLRNPAGEHALVWYSAWDDSAAADRFVVALERTGHRLADRKLAVEPVTGYVAPLVRVVVGTGRLPAGTALPAPCMPGFPACGRGGTSGR